INGPGTIHAEFWFRADSAGRVYVLTDAGDSLFLDPGVQPATGAQLVLSSGSGPATTAFGTFPDTDRYSNQMGPLMVESGTLARGIGLLSSQAVMQTGSSGGFTQGRKLVEASLAGGIHFSPPAPSVQLGIESLSLNVRAEKR